MVVEPVRALGAQLSHRGRSSQVVAPTLVAAHGQAIFGIDLKYPPPPNAKLSGPDRRA